MEFLIKKTKQILIFVDVVGLGNYFQADIIRQAVF
jgi:hypothetical protein